MSSPAHKIRVGNLQVVIWRNTNREKGTTFYTYDYARSYKDGDETWKETTSLSGDEPLVIGKLFEQAWAWVARQRQADYESRKAREKAASDAE